jgi:hypothetical protein
MNTLIQQFLIELEKLPQDRLEQVWDFVQFLKYKQQKAESAMSSCGLGVRNDENSADKS